MVNFLKVAWGGVGKFFAVKAVQWALAIAFSTGFGYWGIDKIKTMYANHQSTERAIAAGNKAVQDLIDMKAAHEEEKARLEADRIAADKARLAVQTRAFAEAGRLKNKIEELEHVANWYSSNVPDDIVRLYEQEFGAGSLHNPEGSTVSPD